MQHPHSNRREGTRHVGGWHEPRKRRTGGFVVWRPFEPVEVGAQETKFRAALVTASSSPVGPAGQIAQPGSGDGAVLHSARTGQSAAGALVLCEKTWWGRPVNA